MRLDGLFYVYAEYCPGDLFWGWWLYAAPIVDGKVDRKRYTWLNYEWRLAAIARDLCSLDAWPWSEHPAHKQHTERNLIHRFLQKRPLGAACLISEDGRKFISVPEHDDRLWDYSRQVRESQLLDWKNDAKEQA